MDVFTEAVFGELLRKVLRLKDNAVMFKPKLEDLEETLGMLDPVVQEIEELSKRINGPDCEKETQNLVGFLEEGKNLVRKCSKVAWINFPKKSRYNKKLEALENKLRNFHSIHMLAYTLRDQKKTLLLQRKIFMSRFRYYWKNFIYRIVDPSTQMPMEMTWGILYDRVDAIVLAMAFFNELGEVLFAAALNGVPDGYDVLTSTLAMDDGTSLYCQLTVVNGETRGLTIGDGAADYKQFTYKSTSLREAEVLKLEPSPEDHAEDDFHLEDNEGSREKSFRTFIDEIYSLSEAGNHRLAEDLALPFRSFPVTSETRSAEREKEFKELITQKVKQHLHILETRSAKHEKESKELITQRESLLRQYLRVLIATTIKLQPLSPALVLLSCFNLVISFLILIYLYK